MAETDDIIEWIEKYVLDSDGEPIKLAPWQKQLAKRIFESDVPIVLLPPRMR